MRWQSHIALIMLALVSLRFAGVASAAPATSISVRPDRSTPGGGYAALIDGIERSDVAQVADSIALPPSAKLTDSERLAYAQSVVLGSRLQWEVQSRFGERAANVARLQGHLAAAPKVNSLAIEWDVKPADMLAKSGLDQIAFGRSAGSPRMSPVMARSAAEHQWRLHRANGAVIILIDVADAPCRNGELRRVLEELKAGRLTSGEAVIDALVLHAAATRRWGAPTDRSTPEGTIAAFLAAIEQGNIDAAADTMIRARDPDNHDLPRLLADEAITAQKLVNAIRSRFDAQQAKRVIGDSGLARSQFDLYTLAAWIVDGDVARAAYDPPKLYQPGVRMVRSAGVWRIELPPTDPDEAAIAARNHQKTRDQFMAARTQIRKGVLANFKSYQTPGAVLEALNVDPAEQPEPDPKAYRKEVEERIASARKEQATRPAATTEEAKQQQIGESFQRLGAAVFDRKPEEAAKYYIADGDGGDLYVLARERRVLAAQELVYVALKEIDSNASQIGGEFHLYNLADDLYGLAMAMEEHDERARAGKKDVDSDPIPPIRNFGGVWKIDVTVETEGHPREQAKRAEAEAKAFNDLAAQIREGKIKTLDALRQAMRQKNIRGIAEAESKER